MDSKDVLIAILAGLVTNFITFLFTRKFTTDKERNMFIEQERKTRSSIAESAVGHLRSSYQAVKQLTLEVLQKQYENREDSQFNTTLWGIKHGLEQIRLSLQGHMNTWKNELQKDSQTVEDINKLLQEDVLAGNIASPNRFQKIISGNVQSISTKEKTKKTHEIGVAVEKQKSKKASLVESMKKSPSERIAEIIASGDIDALDDIVYLEANKNGDIEKIVALGGMAALSGSERAHGVLIEVMRNRYHEMDQSSKTAIFISITQFYVREDREKEGLPVCQDLITLIMEDGSLPESARALALNQLSILTHHADEMKLTLELEEKVLALSPSDPAYNCNHAKTLEKIGNIDKAKTFYEKALEIGEYKDTDHLEAAIRFYSKNGEQQRADELQEMLEEISPEKAEMLKVLSGIFG